MSWHKLLIGITLMVLENPIVKNASLLKSAANENINNFPKTKFS